MKVAISVSENHLSSPVELQFERAAYYIIFELNGSAQTTSKIVHNPNATSMNDNGILTAQLLINLGIDVLLTGWCDPNALRVFQKAKIPIYKLVPGFAHDIIDAYKENKYKLDELTDLGQDDSSTSF
ncbi:MAG: NifB/NifX family molybdenum-iron cluster-binding protein [Calditrichia bacterium]|nr:NifB/NifX family molybdenum-iron cluster-binding protein [Calditrichia bacterium]